MKPLDKPGLTAEQVNALAELYRTPTMCGCARVPRWCCWPPSCAEALLEKHPTGSIYVAWDNAGTHEDDEIEIVVRAAAGRLVLLYLPTCSPWLNPIEMLWRQLRREVTHNELFQTVKSLLAATRDFFDRYNREPDRTLSVIGSHAQNVI